MRFDSDYFSGMDKKASDMRYDPHNIGFSHGVMGDEGAMGAVKTSIFTGAPNVEITFFGAGKGSQKGTPESYGKTEREEIRDVVRVNEVDLSIHATPSWGQIGGSLSGFSQGKFSDESKEIALHEIGRTLDFAADTAGGGPVVFHIDGFPREVFGAAEGVDKDRFQAYPEEAEKSPVRFVDKRTGQVSGLPRNVKVPMQVWDNKKNDYALNEDGTYKIKSLTYDEITKQYEELPGKEKENLKQNWGVDGSLKYFMYGNQKMDIEQMRARIGELERSSKNSSKMIESLDKLEKSYKNILKDEEKIEEAKTLYYEQLKNRGIAPDERDVENYGEFLKNPVKFAKDVKERMIVDRDTARSSVSGFKEQETLFRDRINNTEKIVDYGVREEADTIARAGMQAYDIEKQRGLDKPLWVAPENWAVESYGSHPREYKKIIQESRNNMAERLKKRGMAEEQAKKIAQEHIKGTFDIGHVNMWRRFHSKDEGDFNSWLKSEIKDLVKNDIIGHVHLTDNFGYHDEHIELGEGNALVQDFMDILKKAKFKGKLIAEPGGQKKGFSHRVWTSALEMAGSPIYRVDAASRAWTDIEGSYFGRTQSPNFVVGDYAPSKDWTLWSEVPFE